MLYDASQVLCKQDQGGVGEIPVRARRRCTRIAVVAALLCTAFSCHGSEPDAPSRSSAGHAGSAAGSPAKVEPGATFAVDGAHYGVYRAGRFEVHARSGALLSTLPADERGFRHKLIGGGRVLAPVVQAVGPEEGRMVGLQLRDVRGALLAQIAAPDGVRFTRPSRDAITFAARDRIARHALDGRELWSLPLAAQELAVAAQRDRVALVSADDSRHVTLLDGGRRVADADLREPIWNLALSASGEHVALTTRGSLHAFVGGHLQLNQRLPLRYAVSLALADDGRMLVGGHDEQGRARVLCYAPGGALLAERTLEAEQHAFRPTVRWLDAERWQARSSTASHEDGCPREVER